MNKIAKESLVNKGLAEINPEPFSGEATLVIVGLTRSGTSMMSSLMHAFGVFMGDRIDNAVFEDVEQQVSSDVDIAAFFFAAGD